MEAVTTSNTICILLLASKTGWLRSHHDARVACNTLSDVRQRLFVGGDREWRKGKGREGKERTYGPQFSGFLPDGTGDGGSFHFSLWIDDLGG